MRDIGEARGIKTELISSLRASAPEEFFDSLGAAHSARNARRFARAVGPQVPPDLALGIAGKPRHYKIAVRTTNLELAEKISAKVAGETDVAVVPKVEARNKYQKRARPFDPGHSLAIAGRGWVGTNGLPARDRTDGRIVLTSCSHVFDDSGRIPLGLPVVQPGEGTHTIRDFVAVTKRSVPMTPLRPNLVDFAIADLEDDESIAKAFHNMAGAITKVRATRPSDLQELAFKSGRSTNDTLGVCTAIELDGVAVDMGRRLVLVFDDTVEFIGADGPPFSQAGDSGSGIIMATDNAAVASLNAGGRDSRGIDRTFGNRLTHCQELASVDILTA